MSVSNSLCVLVVLVILLLITSVGFHQSKPALSFPNCLQQTSERMTYIDVAVRRYLPASDSGRIRLLSMINIFEDQELSESFYK